jgi:hypothetical protein
VHWATVGVCDLQIEVDVGLTGSSRERQYGWMCTCFSLECDRGLYRR